MRWRSGKGQTSIPEGKSDYAMRTDSQSGSPAVRQSGSPAVRQSGSPAVIIAGSISDTLVKPRFPTVSTTDASTAAIPRMSPIIAGSSLFRGEPDTVATRRRRSSRESFDRLVPSSPAEGNPFQRGAIHAPHRVATPRSLRSRNRRDMKKICFLRTLRVQALSDHTVPPVPAAANLSRSSGCRFDGAHRNRSAHQNERL